MPTIRLACIVGTLAFAASQAQAASVLFTFQSQFPMTDWHAAWRDGANVVTLDTSDPDGDGIASAVGTLDLATPRVDLFGMPMMDDPILLCANGEAGKDAKSVPLFHTLAGDPLVIETGGPSLGMFTIGQVVNVVNGLVVDFNGSVRMDPGITSATSLLNTDVLALPNYNGQARVVALFSATVVPEPAPIITAATAALGLAVLLLRLNWQTSTRSGVRSVNRPHTV